MSNRHIIVLFDKASSFWDVEDLASVLVISTDREENVLIPGSSRAFLTKKLTISLRKGQKQFVLCSGDAIDGVYRYGLDWNDNFQLFGPFSKYIYAPFLCSDDNYSCFLNAKAIASSLTSMATQKLITAREMSWPKIVQIQARAYRLRN